MRRPRGLRAALAAALAATRAAALAAALTAALAALTAGTAGAQDPPDRWDLARKPSAALDEKKLDEATDKLEDAHTQRNRMVQQQAASEARSLLEELGGARSQDRRVRYLLGAALSLLNDDSGVIATLEPVIGSAFASPLGTRVMFDLAIAYARVERFRDEMSIYDRFLDTVSVHADYSRRMTVLSNRGETRAKLDDFAGSADDFRKVIDVVPTNPMARWGLAVTLDRWGDLAKALEEGGFAWELDHSEPSRLEERGVFFVPAYDRWWYHALRQLSAAQRTQGTAEKIARLQSADRFYETYLAQAPSIERWVPLARARRKMIEGRLVELRKQLAREKTQKKPARPE